MQLLRYFMCCLLLTMLLSWVVAQGVAMWSAKVVLCN